MAKTLVTKTLTDATKTSVTADNDPLLIDDKQDCSVLVSVAGATNGDVISVNLIGGLAADIMETVPMIGCPLTVTIAAGQTSQLFSMNVRAIPFLQVKDIQTTNAGGCTVTVYFGGRG